MRWLIREWYIRRHVLARSSSLQADTCDAPSSISQSTQDGLTWVGPGKVIHSVQPWRLQAPFIKIRHLLVTDLAVVRLLWPFAGGGGPAGAATLSAQASAFLLYGLRLEDGAASISR